MTNFQVTWINYEFSCSIILKWIYVGLKCNTENKISENR